MPVKRSPPASGTDALIGQTIGSHYTLQRFLGHGPRSQAFLATHRSLHRTVVVQLLTVSLPEGSAAASRFDEQAKALAGLEHPNIAAVHDHGRDPGRVWVAVEYVEGETLGDYVRRMGRLQLEAFVPIAAQVLKGLGGAHVRRLVHGDLTASHVMLVEEQGRANYVKLLDLGLASLFAAGEDDAEAPMAGDPAYLAPEVIMNKPVDARSDVYAVGVLFYHMLSGRLPFEGDTPRDVLHKHVNAKPAPLEQALPPNHGVPDELIHLIHDCVAKNPDNRPGDANEIVERMIDCVPAAMFRLPVAAPSSRSGPRHMSKGTGISEAEAAQNRARAATLAAAVEASGTRPIPAVEPPPAPEPVHEPVSSGGGSGWLFALLAVVGVGVGVYFYLESQKPPAPVPVVADPQGQVSVAAGLEKAQELERAGKHSDALTAYEIVLLTDPTNVEARTRQAALKAMLEAAGETPAAPPDTAGEPTPEVEPPATKLDLPTEAKVEEVPQPAALVKIKVEATPKAEVFVDGVLQGKTPLTVELMPGPHAFELKAKGFDTYAETFEAAADGQKELKAKLKRSDRKSFRDEENAASENLDPEEGVGTAIEITRPKKGG